MTAKDKAAAKSGGRPLTPKQEKFCVIYLETGNASEAYRAAYSAAGMKPGTVNRKAKELIDNGKITARLDELRRPAIEAAQMTVEGHLKRLKDLSDAAEKAGQFSAAIKAEENRGKVAGFYVERKEVRVGELENASDEELTQKMLTAARQVAELEGVPVEAVLQQIQGAENSTVH